MLYYEVRVKNALPLRFWKWPTKEKVLDALLNECNYRALRLNKIEEMEWPIESACILSITTDYLTIERKSIGEENS